MRYVYLVLALLATSTLAACNSMEDDPVRTKFVQACESGMKNFVLIPATFCGCTYDKTMSALSGGEQKTARFFLLAQVKVDVKANRLAVRQNWKDVLKVSTALENAGKLCKRR